MSTEEPASEWSRRHLLIVLGIVAAVVAILIAGLTYAVGSALSTDADTDPASLESPDASWPASANGVRGDEYRDAVAAAPMLEVGPADLKPAPPALVEPKRIAIDLPSSTGPADVPTGFPHTPEGAVGQLAAIEITALGPMSLGYARDIHREWASSGVKFDQWEIAQSIQSFHASAGTVDGDGAVTLTATTAGAQIKGTDGPDWVLACVQLDITVTVVDETRFGYGHCDRMQWASGRWMIAPGAPPAQAPSTWPGSQRSLDAGWRLWVDASDSGVGP